MWCFSRELAIFRAGQVGFLCVRAFVRKCVGLLMCDHVCVCVVHWMCLAFVQKL